MTVFALSPQMKELIARAKANADGTATCDPRAMYPLGHRCAPQKSTGLTIDPKYVKLQPAPDATIIRRSPPMINGDKVTEIKTATDTVSATTDANGAVKKVEVKEMKWLMPAALAAAAFILLGG